jgi:hypothetical protein
LASPMWSQQRTGMVVDDVTQSSRQQVEGPGGQRDGQRFVEILGAHERELFGYIFSLTANWDDSQEVMQRLRIRVWEQFDRYDQARPFGAWARAIAYYLVLAAARVLYRAGDSTSRRGLCQVERRDESVARSIGGVPCQTSDGKTEVGDRLLLAWRSAGARQVAGNDGQFAQAVGSSNSQAALRMRSAILADEPVAPKTGDNERRLRIEGGRIGSRLGWGRRGI